MVQNRLSQMTWEHIGLHVMEVLDLTPTCNFINTAIYVICTLPVLQDCCFLHCQMCDWASDKIYSFIWDQ